MASSHIPSSYVYHFISNCLDRDNKSGMTELVISNHYLSLPAPVLLNPSLWQLLDKGLGTVWVKVHTRGIFEAIPVFCLTNVINYSDIYIHQQPAPSRHLTSGLKHQAPRSIKSRNLFQRGFCPVTCLLANQHLGKHVKTRAQT